MGFMAKSPSVIEYGTNLKLKKEGLFCVEKCSICGKNTGTCKHEPGEKIKKVC